MTVVLDKDFFCNVTDCVDRAQKIIHTPNCENSKLAFERDIKYWRAWFEANNLSFDDGINKEILITFIIQHLEEMPQNVENVLVMTGIKKRGLHKVSTVERRLAMLSNFLNSNDLENLCYHKDILALLGKLKIKLGSSQPWSKAMTSDILNNVIGTCFDSIIDVQDRAILLFGFCTGGRRRSEIIDARIENLTRLADGQYIYNLNKSKTNQEGKDDLKPIFGRAALALNQWLEKSGIKQGFIFRTIINNCSVSEKKVSDKYIYSMIKRRSQMAGYNPDDFSAHSLRSGFVTECGKRGKPFGDIMMLTGHKTMRHLMQYYQAGNIQNNSVACLVG